jgi:hypothetical protein
MPIENVLTAVVGTAVFLAVAFVLMLFVEAASGRFLNSYAGCAVFVTTPFVVVATQLNALRELKLNPEYDLFVAIGAIAFAAIVGGLLDLIAWLRGEST